MALSTPALIAVLASYTAFCGLVLYFCVIANPEESKLAYFLQVALPNKLWTTTSQLVGEQQMNVVQTFMDLSLVIFYYFVVMGCWTIVFWYVYPWISATPSVGNYHKYIGILVFFACFGSWRVANKSSPGCITTRSFQRYDHYPYDNLLFVPNRRCETTGLVRIPRSKFDRLKYNQNIPRYDHFCGWVHNTIGEENYRWFLLFLCVHVVMCLYGSTVCMYLFSAEIQDKKLLEITFFDRATGETAQNNKLIVLQYLFIRRTPEFAVMVIMFIMALALGAFLFYHVYLTSTNRTTNEDGKWADVRKWYKTEQKKYKDAVKAGKVTEGTTSSSSEAPQIRDGDVSCTGGGAGIAPQEAASEYFDPGPMPKYLYDRGFIENWKEVLFPISLRKEALHVGGYSKPGRNQSLKPEEIVPTPSSISKSD
eukprot:Nitzschia sp. Nitz4//scaffold119_size111653//90359//91718//NITZ4_004206-RA/size111653-augustus-gene-0.216-mRNA-1//1//CDS//3329533884//207//frame0